MPVRMVFGSIQWFKAADYADLLSMLQQFSGKKIRLMGANTGTGNTLLISHTVTVGYWNPDRLKFLLIS